ncbi:MAG: M48 family metalloprotease [Actinomycetota bacterium]
MTRALAVRRTAIAYGLLALVVAVVTYPIWAFTIGFGWGVLISAVLGALVAGAMHRRSVASALRTLGARPLADGEHPRLDNLVEGLTVAHGFRAPDVHIVDDGAPNVAVLARTPREGTLVVTSGLVERLDRVQLEAVLAHELMRVRRGEATVNLTVASLPARLAGIAPGLAAWAGRRITEGYELVDADLAATEITRYPPGLERALESIRTDGRTVANNGRSCRNLWLDVPQDAVVSSSFTLADRIAVLQEL